MNEPPRHPSDFCGTRVPTGNVFDNSELEPKKESTSISRKDRSLEWTEVDDTSGIAQTLFGASTKISEFVGGGGHIIKNIYTATDANDYRRFHKFVGVIAGGCVAPVESFELIIYPVYPGETGGWRIEYEVEYQRIPLGN